MARKPIRRVQVLEFIEQYKESPENDGNSPTYQEITDHFGWSSATTAWWHVQRLEADGLLALDDLRRIILGGQYTLPETRVKRKVKFYS